MRKDIRLLVLGDEQVGKTSIITSLLTESFSDNVPHLLPEITIPPSVSPDHVTTLIIDSSSRPEDRLSLEKEIREAQLICLVYAVDNGRTFERISSYWLPYIRSLGVNVPVVLVGNKIDTRGPDYINDHLEDVILPIMNGFKEVETCVECSAKTLVNIAEVFYFAQKSILHPTAPLYDSKEQALKPACVTALKRIFEISDSNRDGVLDDDELNDFQIKCFGMPLQVIELEGIKGIVKDISDKAVKDDGLTVDGFLCLHKLFIQRSRLETTWTVLRKFGYDDDISLGEDFLHPQISVPADSTVELSPVGYQFFTELFAKYDKDKDGALNSGELVDLFGTTPGNPWIKVGFPETTVTSDRGAVTLQGFLAQWSMTTLLDYKITLEYLAYLGFPGDSRSALKIIRGRKVDRKKERARRDVFLCLVVGAVGSGKTLLTKSLIGKPPPTDYAPSGGISYAVNSVDMGGAEKYLVMMELSQHQAIDEQVLSDETMFSNYDVVCYVYDSSDPNSFGYVASLRQKYEKLCDIPAVFVATKCDLDRVSQRYEVQPDVYCRQMMLPGPISVSTKDGRLADLFQTIVAVALNPGLGLPTHSSDEYRKKLISSATFFGGTLAILATAFITYRLIR